MIAGIERGAEEVSSGRSVGLVLTRQVRSCNVAGADGWIHRRGIVMCEEKKLTPVPLGNGGNPSTSSGQASAGSEWMRWRSHVINGKATNDEATQAWRVAA